MTFNADATLGDSSTITIHAGVDDIIDTGITEFMDEPHTVLTKLTLDPLAQVGRSYVFSKGATADPVYGLRVANNAGDADVIVDTIESGVTNSYNIGTLPAAALGQSVFIGLLFSGTGWSLYYNGTIGAEAASAAPDVSTGRFEIGGYSPSGDYFVGDIGGVERYSAVLSLAEIQLVEQQTVSEVFSGDSIQLQQNRYRITSQLNWDR